MRKPSCLISCSQPAPAGGLSAGLGKQGSQKSGKVTHRYLGRCRGEHRRARRWCGRLRGGRGDLPGSRGALASGAQTLRQGIWVVHVKAMHGDGG
jgi:hypothetical protein